MSPKFDADSLESFEDFEGVVRIKNMPHLKKKKTGPRPNVKPRPVAEKPAELENQPDTFDFSYNASRHERQWIVDSLSGFYEQHWFDDVLRLIKGGKEASVYQCLGSPTTQVDYIAAKVYRPRMFRNLRKDHIYREGRANLDSDGNQIIDDGMQHAIEKRTEYGLALLHTSWIEHEYHTLEILHAAGADTPRPFARGNNAILMEYIGDADIPAPSLNAVDLARDEAEALFRRVLWNVEVMLSHNRVHADLSAYNILYWDGHITLIDFPQAIDPRQNHNAYRIFERDITRTCEYFQRQGVSSKPREIAARMWQEHQYPLYPQLDPKYLDAENEEDRQRWENARP